MINCNVGFNFLKPLKGTRLQVKGVEEVLDK
jgi:hypothetical protein